VDVGGTKTVAGLVSRDGRIIASGRVPTPRQGERPVVSAIIDLLRQVMSDVAVTPQQLASVGIAVPAVIAQDRGVVLWAPNITEWQQETPVAGEVAQALSVGTSLHYDGHAWVMGEWWLGAARGASDAALIAVGTGVGGGMIIGGRLHCGRVGVAGAIGWWSTICREADRTGRSLPAGRLAGPLESVASGPAIARGAGQATAEEAFAAARRGDAKGLAAVNAAAEALGTAVADLASLLDPEVIVLAGGVAAGGGDLLLRAVEKIARAKAQPQIAASVRLAAAELGDDAPWLGAAQLGLNYVAGRGAA
jgi:glucokinase